MGAPSFMIASTAILRSEDKALSSDELAAKAGAPVSLAKETLKRLVAQGKVRKLPNGKFEAI